MKLAKLKLMKFISVLINRVFITYSLFGQKEGKTPLAAFRYAKISLFVPTNFLKPSGVLLQHNF